MDPFLAAKGDFAGAAELFGFVVGLILLLIVCFNLAELIYPRKFGGRMRRFFGARAYAKLETHDKSFPAWDLPSVSRALESFRAECCSEQRELGACQFGSDSLRKLMDQFANHRPTKPPNERMPVDVESEQSFPTNGVYLAVLKPEFAPPLAAGDRARRIAVLIASQSTHVEYGFDMESPSHPPTMLALSIACHSKEIADRFFREIEQRRKRL